MVYGRGMLLLGAASILLAGGGGRSMHLSTENGLSAAQVHSASSMSAVPLKVEKLDPALDQIIPAEKIAEIKAEEEKKKHDDYVAKLAEENAPRRATIKSRNKETDRADRLKKRQREQQQEEEEQCHR